MKSSITRIPATAFLFFCCAVTTQAQPQNSGPVLVDIAPCMNLAGNAERYACYDKLEQAVRAAHKRSAEQLSADPPAAPVTPAASNERAAVTSPSGPAPTTTSVAEFGQQSPVAAEAATVRANQDGEEELHDRIVNVQEREPGRALITLESGQVWYQSNSQRFRLVKGMAVRIYPSPLRGSYRLARDDGKETGFIQVARVK